MKEEALADIKKMEGEAREILAALETARAGIEGGDIQAVRDGLSLLGDNTYSYASGIVGFTSRTDSLAEFVGELEEAAVTG